RGEIVGSTRKMFQQKGTGNARRGPIRSPLLKGGGKAFGPRNEANFIKNMPKKMGRAALFSCLSLRAKEGVIIGLEDYGDDVKTKTFMALLKKLPVEYGRRILFVLPGRHRGLELSARNVPRVKTIFAPYLNPEDVLGSKHIVFLKEAVQVAEDTFVKEKVSKPLEVPVPKEKKIRKPKTEKPTKKPSAPKKAKAKA
ncbi:50S ribosomal protein L4, partial [Candidatus Peribacteria bacterium]|nr:50S ribosomal protein L4 [Candidatus Peribacteria bacterium]